MMNQIYAEVMKKEIKVKTVCISQLISNQYFVIFKL